VHGAGRVLDGNSGGGGERCTGLCGGRDHSGDGGACSANGLDTGGCGDGGDADELDAGGCVDGRALDER